jgi:hypothetical protein
VVAVIRYDVTAKRWKHGWELHIRDVGVTQARTLGRAEQQVRDYIETLLDVDVSDAEIVIAPELGDVGERARRARERVRAAEHERSEAAREARDVAHQLRDEGMSVSDLAAVLGVSRGRVSQLLTKGGHEVKTNPTGGSRTVSRNAVAGRFITSASHRRDELDAR